MTRTFSGAFAVSIDQSHAFARLSGDFNPLHLDPVAARRTPFGGSVTHGVHLFLAALDQAAEAGLLVAEEPEALSATFHGPVHSGVPVSLALKREDRALHLAGEAAGRPAFSGVVALGAHGGPAAELQDADFPPADPSELDFPPPLAEGEVPLRLDRDLLASLFPSISVLAPQAWIADLLASTQLVGMRCPGMASLYSRFKLRRAPSEAWGPSLRYRIQRLDERFRMVRLEVVGSRLTGTLNTFFRPRPVRQRAMPEVMGAVPPHAFTGERALVVGGSRGLGELTAKILAAGGADVVVTYARGGADAERVCSEVRAAGRACSARLLDVLESSAAPPGWLSETRFTHVYYFASPPISRNTADWSEALYRQFERVYVDAFGALVAHVTAGRDPDDAPARFLYPSSVFVTEPEDGFSEYAAAKAAGEALCDRLEGRGARFLKPRLPRVRTDQTSSITGSEAPDGFPVMLDVIRELHS
jgi:acyl dehydratase